MGLQNLVLYSGENDEGKLHLSVLIKRVVTLQTSYKDLGVLGSPQSTLRTSDVLPCQARIPLPPSSPVREGLSMAIQGRA